MSRISTILLLTALSTVLPGWSQSADQVAERILSQQTGGSPNAAVLNRPRLLTDEFPEAGTQLLGVRRVYVDELTGDDTADQIRDLIIASLHGAGLFVVTENEERADAFLRGAAEDLVYTDQFQSGEGADLRTSGSSSTPGEQRGTERTAFAIALGDDESVNIRERRHEALASVRLVNLDGDVIWSTTQESKGAKFRGASADVAAKITKQLTDDYRKVAAADSDFR